MLLRQGKKVIDRTTLVAIDRSRIVDILPALSLTLAGLKTGKDGDSYGAIR